MSVEPGQNEKADPAKCEIGPIVYWYRYVCYAATLLFPFQHREESAVHRPI